MVALFTLKRHENFRTRMKEYETLKKLSMVHLCVWNIRMIINIERRKKKKKKKSKNVESLKKNNVGKQKLLEQFCRQ